MTFSQTLLRTRFKKFRRIGSYGTYFQATLASEVVQFQDLLRRGIRELRDRIQGRPAEAGDPPQETRASGA